MYVPQHIRWHRGMPHGFAVAWRAPYLLALIVILGCDGPPETGIAGPSAAAVGTATRLVFTVEPNATTATAAIFPAVKVTALNASGNTATDFKGKVTVAIGTNPTGGVLQGTTGVTAVTGVATFSNLIISKAGTGYTLTATSGKLTPDTSVAFNVALPATRLLFSVQPSTTSQGATISPSVQVTALDKNGHLAEGYRQNVTIAIGTNPNAGTLAGTKTVTFVHGIATFSDLSIDKVGSGYTLQATSLKLAATSAVFDISTSTPTPTIVDLGTLPGGTNSSGQGINNGGQVVGEGDAANGQYHGFLWTPTQPRGLTGSMIDLGTLPGGTYSSARAINDVGQVVGLSDRADGEIHAVLWENNGTVITDLGTLEGGNSSAALGINASGQVVGYSTLTGGGTHAFRWANDVMEDLGTLPGGSFSQAEDINSQGDVVGQSETEEGHPRATVWLANGQIINLGTLGGTYSQGFDINDAGKAVGNSGASNEASRGFLWENPTMTELGRLAEVNTHSGANSINNSAAAVEIVGTSQTQGGSTTHAVLWRNGAIMDLGTLGGDNSNADGINDSSQIAGGSLLTGNTAYHAALWVGF